MDDRNPYPVLLGIDWVTDMNGVINLKKKKMIFENKFLSIVVPLDPAEGPCHTEPVHGYESDDDLDQIYKITVRDQDWVNLKKKTNILNGTTRAPSHQIQTKN